MDGTVICLVRGPASRYPRGFVWLIPVWFAVLAAVALLVGRNASGRLPFWLGVTEIGGLAIAAVTVFCVLVTVRKRAFRADSHGIVLGIATRRRRPRLRQVQLVWPEIAQLRMEPRRYGAMLEITLSPAARTVRRPGIPMQALLLLGSLVLPLGFGRGRPALTTPAGDPLRYRLKIYDLNPAQLREALAAVRPSAVPVRVLTKKPALRFAVPPQAPSQVKPVSQSPAPVSQQPPAPVA